MHERTARIILALLVIVGVVVGAWAAFDPHGFYRDFPGGGRQWVAVDGPYNQHLVRDFGALNLALVAVAMVAFWRPRRELLIAVAVGNLAYDIPHLVYHLRHLDVYDTADKIANVASLSSALVLPLLLLAVAMRRAGRQTPVLPNDEDRITTPL